MLQEESHKNIGHGGSFVAKLDSIAMYVNSKGNNAGNANWSKGNNKKERPLYKHCNMLGHTIDKCYKLHGYPPEYKLKGKSNANQVFYDQGTLVEQPSFGTAQCPISKAQCEQLLAYFNTSSGFSDKHRAATISSGDGVPSLMTTVAGVASFVGVPASAGMAVTTSQPSASNSYLETMAGMASGLPFISNLKHSIFSAKLVNKDMFSSTGWVIDTGATNHMVHSVSFFTTITFTLNTHVNLPNGEIALVTHVGTVKIIETLVLYDVLCVPTFSFNLISMSKLAKSVLCCLIFLETFCFIQDLIHWSTIGLGREYNGLYLLEQSKSISSSISAVLSVNKVQPHVWHLRLGHLSNAKLALMKFNKVSLHDFVNNFHCDICPIAKQKRLPFNKSSHVSKNCFDLLHCDLWGPFSVPTIDNCKYFLTIVDDCSRSTWVYLLKHKSQTQSILEQFCNLVEN